MDKKDFRAQIETKLEAALAEFGKGIAEKKFKKHIKKASKLLAEGFASAPIAIEPKPAVPATIKPVKQAKAKKAAAKPAEAEKVEKVEKALVSAAPVKKAAKKVAAKKAAKATTTAPKSKKTAESPAV